MPHYEKAPKEVRDMADDLLSEFAPHKPVIDAGVKIDILMAFGEKDEDGQPVTDAIKHHGIKALGLTRIVNTKDRVKGMGDCEILLDGDWWADASVAEQRALLDHELFHVSVRIKDGAIQTDEIGRPKLRLRKHSFEVGWFTEIAERHGPHSIECQQAKAIADRDGQFYWPGVFAPDLAKTVAFKSIAKSFRKGEMEIHVAAVS